MNKNLRNLLGAIRCKTELYANKAKAQDSLLILTDYTCPTVKMLCELQNRIVDIDVNGFIAIEELKNIIYIMEAQTEDYIRGGNHEAQIKEGN